MKHYIRFSAVLLLFIVLAACNNTITPLSTAVNNNQVNSPTNTNNVSSNTSFTAIGTEASWIVAACQGQTCLTTVNTAINSTVTICFSSPPTVGMYQLVSSNSLLGPGKAFLTVLNPPGQTSGSIWYSSSGTVNVFNPISTNIDAAFTNIPCLNNPTTQDTVFVSGQVGCL